MSYASVSSIAIPALPTFDSRALRHTARKGAALGLFALQSVGLAAALWLLLAGPALMSGGAQPGRVQVAARG